MTDQFLIFMFILVYFLALIIIGGFLYWFGSSLLFFSFLFKLIFNFFILIIYFKPFYFSNFILFFSFFLFFSPFSPEPCG